MPYRVIFATGMLRKYRRGLQHGEMIEDQFLCYITKIMNTSAEMLRVTCIASDENNFEVYATMVREIMGACAD